MKIVIRNTAGQPIYEQIKEQVKAAVYTGELAEGDMLPSIRQLARDLKISVITTTRAYSDLEQEGFIASVQGLPRDVRRQLHGGQRVATHGKEVGIAGVGPRGVVPEHVPPYGGERLRQFLSGNLK